MKFLGLLLTVMLCASVAMAGYRYRYYGGHKLGGYAYRPVKYAPHVSYRKPVLHHAPVVYAHKSYSKPHTTHYFKPTYHHQVPHHAPVYHSKPVVYHLGGHVGHRVAYKPVVRGYGHAYALKSRYHH